MHSLGEDAWAGYETQIVGFRTVDLMEPTAHIAETGSSIQGLLERPMSLQALDVQGVDCRTPATANTVECKEQGNVWRPGEIKQRSRCSVMSRMFKPIEPVGVRAERSRPDAREPSLILGDELLH